MSWPSASRSSGCTVSWPVRSLLAARPVRSRAGDGLEAPAHHPKGLPQQGQEAGSVEDGEDLGNQGIHGLRPAGGLTVVPVNPSSPGGFRIGAAGRQHQAQSVVQAAPKARKASRRRETSMAVHKSLQSLGCLPWVWFPGFSGNGVGRGRSTGLLPSWLCLYVQKDPKTTQRFPACHLTVRSLAVRSLTVP